MLSWVKKLKFGENNQVHFNFLTWLFCIYFINLTFN